MQPGPLATPIVQTSTFAFASAAEMRRYVEGDDELFLYTRYANPTVRALEQSLAALEGAEAALALSSGMAAMTSAVLSLVRGRRRGARQPPRSTAARCGCSSTRCRASASPGGSSRTRTCRASTGSPATRPRVLILESPTNPDARDRRPRRRCAQAAHARGIAVIVDNTFATPHLQRPLALGADLVMHSLTKALAGHSDLIAGALAGSRERIDAARATMKVLGGCLDPHAAFLAQRGVKTLHLRVERQCANALALARRLEGHPRAAPRALPGAAVAPRPRDRRRARCRRSAGW